jgi:hypothetical protein
MLSSQATAGTESPACIRLPARAHNQALLLLVDSGSSHSFVSAEFVRRVKLQTISIPAVSVKVANGQNITCDSMVKQMEWHSQGHTLKTDLRVLDLDSYDGVLGMDWLDEHSPMDCGWKEKRICFDHEGEWVTLQGITAATVPAPILMDVAMLQQLYDNNEIWALASLEHVPGPKIAELDTVYPEVQAVLLEYDDVFAEPIGLPPHRQYDHAITLEEGAKPPNAKPYRYSPLQKD